MTQWMCCRWPTQSEANDRLLTTGGVTDTGLQSGTTCARGLCCALLLLLLVGRWSGGAEAAVLAAVIRKSQRQATVQRPPTGDEALAAGIGRHGGMGPLTDATETASRTNGPHDSLAPSCHMSYYIFVSCVQPKKKTRYSAMHLHLI